MRFASKALAFLTVLAMVFSGYGALPAQAEGDDCLAKISIHKIDGTLGTDLCGAVFAVEVKTPGGWIPLAPFPPMITNSHGNATSEGLLPGTYRVVEITPPPGYALNCDPSQEVTLAPEDAGKTIPIPGSLKNERLKGAVHIFKDIECYVGCDYEKVKFTYKLTNKATNEVFTGTGPGEGLGEITVPYGTYTLSEIDIPAGFKFVKFTDCGKAVTDVKVDCIYKDITCHNERVASLLITKDDGQGKRLTGAHYNIFFSECEGGPWKQVGDTVVTGANGEISLKNQPLGWYKVVETAPPMGYAATADDCIVRHLNVAGETETFAFHNAQLFGSLEITKQVTRREGDTGAAPEFTVHIVGPSGNPNVASASHDYAITEGVNTIPNLAYGEYEITEVNIPAGFDPNYTISAPGFTIGGQTAARITLGNTRLYGAIVVTKAVKNGSTQPGDKFVFDLIQNGSVVATQTITAPASTCTFTDLAYGDYTVKEHAAEGYERPAEFADGVPVAVSGEAESIKCENTKLYGSITVTKAFRGPAPADGAKFTFSLWEGDSKIGEDKTLTWGSDGNKIVFAYPGYPLEYGHTYTVKEESKTGFVTDPAFAAGVSRTIGANEPDHAITCTNEQCGRIEITKKDAGDPDVLLGGAVFRVTGVDDPDVSFTLTTAAEGEALGTATSGWLAPGAYVVQEITPPDGYHINDDSPRKLTVKAAGTVPAVFTDSLGSVLVYKHSSYGDKPPVGGVVFQLLKKAPGADGTAEAGSVVGTATTGTNGYAEFTGALIGHDYWVREIQQAPGYDIDRDLVVKVKASYKPDKPHAVFVNNPLGKIGILKYDAATVTGEDFSKATKLSGAVFGIFTSESCAGTPLATLVSGTAGPVFSAELPFGGDNPAAYYVKEMTPPAGYLPSTDVKSVAFTSPGQTVELRFTNVRNVGSLIIRKVDALNAKKTLAGATFQLYSDAALTVKAGSPVTTLADGLARFDELAPGDYWLVETAAPKNYNLLKASIPVTVAAGVTQPEALVIQNQYNPPEDIATGMMDWNILILGCAGLLAGGLILLLTRKRHGKSAS